MQDVRTIAISDHLDLRGRLIFATKALEDARDLAPRNSPVWRLLDARLAALARRERTVHLSDDE